MPYILLLILLAPISGISQDSSTKFDSLFDEFIKTEIIHYYASFKGYGKNVQRVTEATGKIAIEKNGLDILKYRSNSISQIGILGKINFEDIIYDGLQVYVFNYENQIYENKGTWEGSGKKYSGYSSILYNNLSVTLKEFNNNKNKIIYHQTEDGFQFKLPAQENSGEIILFFNPNCPMPYKIIRYNKKENDQDYVILELHDILINPKLPDTFFRKPLSEIQNNSDHLAFSGNIQSKDATNNHLLSPGSIAPAWELKNSQGETRKLSDYKGKYVVLDFWATWCAPCIMGQPFLQKIHQSFSNVSVLGMNYNEKKYIDLNVYKSKNKLEYEMILNAESIGKEYNIVALPSIYVIDPNGLIIHNSLGYSEEEETKLIEVIEKHVGEKKQ